MPLTSPTVLVLASGGSSENQWDAHSDLEANHGRMAGLTIDSLKKHVAV